MKAKAGSARRQDSESVEIKEDEGAEGEESEGIEKERSSKVTVEEVVSGAGAAAGRAGKAGQRMENAGRRGQPGGKPEGKRSKSAKRDQEPEQLMIDFAWREGAAASLHRRSRRLTIDPGQRPQGAEHDAEEEDAPATDDDRQEDGENSATGCGLVRASQADAFRHE